jgi:ComB9 competence protein
VKNTTLLLVCIVSILSQSAYATKGGLLTDDASILGVPPDAINSNEVPDPRLLDLTDTLDRTNQDMKLKSLNATQAVFDDSSETANTLITSYTINKTIKIRTREFMGTLIVLPDGDTIKMWKLGDESNFSFKPSISISDTELPNTGSIDVILAGADTSLHILGTSGNVYSFYVRGDTWDSKFNPTMKVIIKDQNLQQLILEKISNKNNIGKISVPTGKVTEQNNKKDYLEAVVFDPASIDFGYRIKGGNDEIRPYMVYSDEQFTYFRYAKEDSVSHVKSFPAVYRVADGSDVPTNTTAMGSTLRVEGVANQWTLRLGKDFLCIERMTKLPSVESSMNAVQE